MERSVIYGGNFSVLLAMVFFIGVSAETLGGFGPVDIQARSLAEALLLAVTISCGVGFLFLFLGELAIGAHWETFRKVLDWLAYICLMFQALPLLAFTYIILSYR